MTTGFHRADWRMGGAVPGKVTGPAGSRIPIFDYVFTTGPSPWTKTVIGTNIVRYQAPGGSQVKLEIEDTSVLTSGNYHIRVRMSVGAGALIPSAAHEANGTFGHMLIAMSQSNTATWFEGWYAIRTDRFAMMMFGGSTSSTGSRAFIVGDLPTYDPADPGLCVLLGYASNVYSGFPTASVYEDSTFGSSLQGNLRRAGFATIDKQNTFTPVPAGVMPDFSSSMFATLSSYAGYIPLGFMNVYTSTSAFANPVSTASVLRGWIPFVRTMPVSSTFLPAFYTQNFPTGDTFTADGVEFETFCANQNYQRLGWMLSDGEDLP